jgi:hypothetical protein
MRRISLALMGMMMAGAVQAEPLTGKQAKSMLFEAEGAEVEMLAQDFLSDSDVAALQIVGAAQPYYGAIAVSPDEGLMVEATVAAAKYHDTDAASVAALAACDAKRQGNAPCVVVALIRPLGWSPQPLQLSADATAGFAKDYKGSNGKALAISASTGGWGIAVGDNAAANAVSTCLDRAGVTVSDCAVVIAD